MTTANQRIAAKVFGPTRAIRNLVAEPLTADDWRRVWEARKSFVAALRQIAYEARCREAEKNSGQCSMCSNFPPPGQQCPPCGRNGDL